MKIVSKLVLGTAPTPKTARKLRRQGRLPTEAVPTSCVFEVTVAWRTRYCCWAGGRRAAADGAPPDLTLAGQAAVESLLHLPFVAPGSTLLFAELCLGPTPLQDKIVTVFECTNDDVLICFFGDLANELDGHMTIAFNVQDAVELDKCIGPTRDYAPSLH